NTGCDTLTIFSGSIIGNGFLLRDISFPVFLPPHKEVAISIASVLDTVGRKQKSEAVFSLQTNALYPIEPITLKRKNIYPRKHNITISNEVKNGMPGDTIELQINSDGLENVQSLDM